MPRRRLKIKLDKLRLGISFVLAIVSYNISDWIFEINYDITIWKWLKSHVFTGQSVRTVMLAWILLFIAPILIWYKIMGLYFGKSEKT